MYDPDSPFTSGDGEKSLRPQQKTDFAESRLYQAVISCELRPGTSSTEAELADRFGIGRAAVRVALARLSALALMAPQPRLGWRVQPISGGLIGDVIEARQRIEPALAASRPGPEARAEMHSYAERIEAIAGQRHQEVVDSRRSYERRFRDQLASGINPLLFGFLKTLWDQSTRITNFLEADGAAHLPPMKASALLHAVDAQDSDRIADILAKEIEAFERFARDALLSNRTELEYAPAPQSQRAETEDLAVRGQFKGAEESRKNYMSSNTQKSQGN